MLPSPFLILHAVSSSASLPLRWACNYKLDTFVKSLVFGKTCASDSDCDTTQMEYCDLYNQNGATCMGGMSGGSKPMAESGLNTGTYSMLKNCKAMTMMVPEEKNVPVPGPDGWLKYGQGA